MSVTYSINRVEKYNNISLPEVKLIQTYVSWKHNPWNFLPLNDGNAPYPTFKEYWDHNVYNEDYPGEPDPQVVEWYEHRMDEDNIIYETLGWWKSSARFVLEFMKNHATQLSPDTYIIDEKVIPQLESWYEQESLNCRLVPAYVDYSFSYDEKERIIMTPCVGIVATDAETGEERRIPTNNDELGELIYVPSKYFDESKYLVLNQLGPIIDIIKNTDLEKYILWFDVD